MTIVRPGGSTCNRGRRELTQSCPVRPRRPHLPWCMRARCRSTSRHQGGLATLQGGTWRHTPAAGGACGGLAIAARETRTPQCEPLPRSVFLVWRFVDPSTASNCALSRDSAYRRSNDPRPVLVQVSDAEPASDLQATADLRMIVRRFASCPRAGHGAFWAGVRWRDPSSLRWRGSSPGASRTSTAPGARTSARSPQSTRSTRGS